MRKNCRPCINETDYDNDENNHVAVAPALESKIYTKPGEGSGESSSGLVSHLEDNVEEPTAGIQAVSKRTRKYRSKRRSSFSLTPSADSGNDHEEYQYSRRAQNDVESDSARGYGSGRRRLSESLVSLSI